MAFMLPLLLGGRTQVPESLIDTLQLDVETLPYNQKLLAWLRLQKAAGSQLILITAGSSSIAGRIAQHLNLFDQVLVANADGSSAGLRKRILLVQHFGEKGFDYVGAHKSSTAVFSAANNGHLVSDSQRKIQHTATLCNLITVFSKGNPPRLTSLLKAVRLHQWMKNFLVFVPYLAAHQVQSSLSGTIQTVLAFVVFGLTASSAYILNDLLDIEHDRHHSRKCRRPFAAGHLDLGLGWAMWPTLLVAAFVIALCLLPPIFTIVLACYFSLTIAYSLRLKQIVMLDVLGLAMLYTLRIIAGAVAVPVPLSFWLLAFSMFLFLSLAFIKRYGELYGALGAGIRDQIRGRGYYPEDMSIVSSLGTAAGYIAVLVLALYIQDKHTAELYATPEIIWSACPFLLYWISRAWLIAHRGEMHHDPIVFALKDRVSWIIGSLVIGVFLLARVMK